MNRMERVAMEYFNSRKKLEVEEGSELAKKVSEVEEEISKKMTIWGDEEKFEKFKRINSLSLSERRLIIVFVIFDCSPTKVAKYFGVDRKTISSRITSIKNKVLNN